MKIKKSPLFILFLLLLVSSRVFSQISKAEWSAFSKIPDSTKIAEIKNGGHLKFFKELSIEKFIETLIQRGNTYVDKAYGKIRIQELYKDSAYTYFGNIASQYLSPYYKVSTSDLIAISFMDINGKEIRTKFIEEIIALEDKRKVAEKEAYCRSSFNNSYFKYKYNKEKKLVDITYKWEIDCSVYKIVKKAYSAKFDLLKKQFIK